MRVLQIYKDYYPPVKGGIEKHINLLSKGLLARGIQVDVLVSNTRWRMEKEFWEGVPVYKVSQLGRVSSAPINMTLPYWVKRLGDNADILHFHFPNPTAELSYLVSGSAKKFIVTYHSDIIKQVYLKKIYEPFMHRFLRRASGIIVTSPRYCESSEILCKFRKNCEIIPLGIDLSKFKCSYDVLAESSKLREKYGKPIILFVGKFRYYKGVHVLIEAMKHIDGKLLMVGPDLDSDQVIHQIERAGLKEKIDVIGEIADEKLNNYLYACDIFVLPSVKRSEAFGIVQLEAMACGKAVVCTEIGTGTSFVNKHMQTGLVVPPNKPEALAESINHLLNNPFIRQKYGQCGMVRVNNFFSLNKMVDKIELLYKRVLNQ